MYHPNGKRKGNQLNSLGSITMKRRLKTHLMIASIIVTLLMAVPLLSCATQAVSETKPQTPNLPTTPAIPNTPTMPSPPTEPQPVPEPQTEVSQVNIVYFHRTNRCHSCKYSEAQTSATLDTYFADELASGKITFVSVDVQDESNAAIIEKYGAYGPQLFISVLKGDTENIIEVQEFWDFIDDDEGFSNLIIDKVNEALEAADL
jgi:cytochrome oxidase Cu insertion factor (SCO1/SenC/PrrC family)